MSIIHPPAIDQFISDLFRKFRLRQLRDLLWIHPRSRQRRHNPGMRARGGMSFFPFSFRMGKVPQTTAHTNWRLFVSTASHSDRPAAGSALLRGAPAVSAAPRSGTVRLGIVCLSSPTFQPNSNITDRPRHPEQHPPGLHPTPHPSSSRELRFTLRWVLPELHHLPQTHARRREGAVMGDLVHQGF